MRFELSGIIDPEDLPTPPPEPEPDPDPDPDPPPPPEGDVLWEDHFLGAEGDPPDPDSFVVVTSTGETWDHWCKCLPENVYQDGDSHLVLRTKPDTAGPNGLPYSGGWLATFDAQSGYPSAGVLRAFEPPFAYETRFLFPNVAGAHFGSGWVQQVDHDESEIVYELDCCESRSTFPTETGFYTHKFLSGVDLDTVGVVPSITDGRVNWHVGRVEVRTSEVKYFLDGVLKSTAYGVTGLYGMEASCAISNDPWQSGGGSPSGVGPWYNLIDYVRFLSLT